MNLSIPEIPVIYFHSIAPKKHQKWVRNFLTLELQYFEELLKYLRKHQWKSIFLDEYYQIKQSGKKPKGKMCCITFDDGFLDNYIYVFPLLNKYGFKGTVFINPEFVDLKRNISKTIEDVWANNSTMSEIDKWGYLSWNELRLMQQSGTMDVQSHTLTHTKYFISDEIISFHRPGSDSLYPVGNLFPHRKPYYIEDNEFENLIPFGTPYFRESSSVVAKRVFINEAFNNLMVEMLSNFRWDQAQAVEKAFVIINEEYQLWKKGNKIIDTVETQEEYEKRLYYEIVESKNIIERELNKRIEFLCWPHGDNNEIVHQFALNSGYLATTTGSKQNIKSSVNRISKRTSVGVVYNSLLLTNMKTRYRLSLSAGNPSMQLIHSIIQKLN